MGDLARLCGEVGMSRESYNKVISLDACLCELSFDLISKCYDQTSGPLNISMPTRVGFSSLGIVGSFANIDTYIEGLVGCETGRDVAVTTLGHQKSDYYTSWQ